MRISLIPKDLIQYMPTEHFKSICELFETSDKSESEGDDKKFAENPVDVLCEVRCL